MENFTPYANINSTLSNYTASTAEDLKVNTSSGFNTHCMFQYVTIALIFGTAANIAVVVVVLKDRQMHKSTFVVIAALAIPDGIFILANIIVSIFSIITDKQCRGFGSIQNVVDPIMGVIWFSSSFHITFIAVLRYLLLTHPLKADAWLSPKRIIIISGLIWMAGGVVMTLLSLANKLGLSGQSTLETVLLLTWTILYLIPLIVTIVLHVMKIRRVRSSVKYSGTGTLARQKSVVRMTKVIIVVVILFGVLPLPKLLLTILFAFGNLEMERRKRMILQDVAQFIFMTSNVINPILYAFMSPQFRKRFKRLCMVRTDKATHTFSASIKNTRSE
ncbi:hypothetical protein ACJMK2_013973 [Sinanodonta woodiana]|uniref:G-protein coupled receptors family 1 profile domain-containing protein n=1 Tax=Sinanodonta woodiana TaxID=1069815 RepID=A0ABD3UZX7_SINWO